MADEPTQSEIDKLLHRVDEAINGHKNSTKDDLAGLRRELVDMLENVKRETSDTVSATVKELQEGLKDVSEYVRERREADKQKAKVSESESTMVIPPKDVTPPPPSQPEEQSYSTGEAPRRSAFKRFW